jgi:hypothetical protein
MRLAWHVARTGDMHAHGMSLNIVMETNCGRLRWAERVGRIGRTRNAYRILVGKPFEWDHFEEWEGVGFEGGRWIELVQNRVHWRAVMLAVLNLEVLMSKV